MVRADAVLAARFARRLHPRLLLRTSPRCARCRWHLRDGRLVGGAHRHRSRPAMGRPNLNKVLKLMHASEGSHPLHRSAHGRSVTLAMRDDRRNEGLLSLPGACAHRRPAPHGCAETRVVSRGPGTYPRAAAGRRCAGPRRADRSRHPASAIGLRQPWGHLLHLSGVGWGIRTARAGKRSSIFKITLRAKSSFRPEMGCGDNGMAAANEC